MNLRTISPTRAFLFSVLVVSVFFVSVANSSSTLQSAEEAGEEAYSKLRAAEKAGANVTALGTTFNDALELLEYASRLERSGDLTQASSVASEAEELYRNISVQAEEMESLAVSKRQEDYQLQIQIIPLAALLIAIGITAAMGAYRWVRSKQFGELRLKVKSES